MNKSIIVWDLETVPDIRGFGAANGLVGKTNEEIREELGDKFPKHIYHSIVCIGALVSHRELDGWVDSPGVGGQRFERLRSKVVTAPAGCWGSRASEDSKRGKPLSPSNGSESRVLSQLADQSARDVLTLAGRVARSQYLLAMDSLP
jgi:hypothetical protein